MDKYLTVINHANPFDQKMQDDFSYVPFVDASGETFIEEKTLEAFKALNAYLEETYDYTIEVLAAGRTIESQSNLFNNLKNKISEKEAIKKMSAPGESEHHLGLSLDVNMHELRPKFIQKFINRSKFLKQYFERKEKESGKTDEMFHILHNVMIHYGFILRYPKNKSNKTGKDGNRFHIRYVGEKHATEMHDKKMCLEE